MRLGEHLDDLATRLLRVLERIALALEEIADELALRRQQP